MIIIIIIRATIIHHPRPHHPLMVAPITMKKTTMTMIMAMILYSSRRCYQVLCQIITIVMTGTIMIIVIDHPRPHHHPLRTTMKMTMTSSSNRRCYQVYLQRITTQPHLQSPYSIAMIMMVSTATKTTDRHPHPHHRLIAVVTATMETIILKIL